MSAEEKPDPIADLLASIADGAAPDWDAARRDAAPERVRHVEMLRQVARIADFNRSLQRGGDAGDRATPPGERWGPLVLLERLGVGSRAQVFRAWDPALQREVALKLLHGDPADGGREALLDEARAAARVRHPNVVAIHGIAEHDGIVGLWMDLVRGGSLQHIVGTRGPLDVSEAVRLARDVAAALAAVHEAGLVHRDVKPANIVHDQDGRWVLLDFGLGRLQPRAAADLGPSGTPMYMAPELFRGGVPTAAADVYSLGLVLWFALAGRAPLTATTLGELAAAVEREPAPLDTVRTDVPPALRRALAGATATAPEQRTASAVAFRAALDAIPARTPLRRRRARIAAGATALLVVAGIASLLRDRPREIPVIGAGAPDAAGALAAVGAYSVEVRFLRRGATGAHPLRDGDRIRPGDHLSLEFRASRPAFVYVLNEDERGQHFLLFPQPRFDRHNPLPADSLLLLPGTIGGRENAWTVTSAGGREHFVIVASPEPIDEIEADLGRLPAAMPGRPIEYAPVGAATLERLRGVGGVSPLPPGAASPTPRARALERFRALAGREDGVHGIWVREVVLDNE